MDGGAQFKYLFLGSSFPGFTIDFYSAGTLTGKNVWVDENKSSAVQRVSADSYGMAVWYADGDYRVRIKDADGTLLWDWPSIKITSDTATMWEGNFGLSYPTATSTNIWQMFAKHDASNNFLELGINTGEKFVKIYPSIPATTFDDLNNAISQMGSTQCELLITEEIAQTGNAVVPSTMVLDIRNGGSINQGTYSLLINSPFTPGFYRAFTGSGAVTFGTGSVKEAY